MTKDHLGNEFKGVREMYLYYQRKRNGMSLEKILTTPRRMQKNSCLDDTLIYKRHHREKTSRPVKLKSESAYRMEHGSVTVKEYWRG